MKVLRLCLLCALLALISVPVICAAGWMPHCTAEFHEHDATDHHAAPHSSCVGNSPPPIQKFSQVDRIVQASVAAVTGPAFDAGPDRGGRQAAAAVAETIPDRGECPPPLLN